MMERRDEKRFVAYTTTTMVLMVIILSAQNIDMSPLSPSRSQDQYATAEKWSFDIGYLDDTRHGDNYTWSALISNTRDMGVMWINNTGTDTDTYETLITKAPDGWIITPRNPTVTVHPENDMGVVLLDYEIPPGASGSGSFDITVESQKSLGLSMSMTIICDIERTDGNIAGVGSTFMVEYSLTDEEGNAIDSGTLPVTAGERYVGPGNQLRYIEGFYLAPLGMRMPDPGILRGENGETKTVRLPPELAYGTKPADEGGHQLGGVTLIFTITILTQDPL